ncbi:MAG: hypothetical protein Q8Q91_00270 [Candidatus Daviesbacteria bacterium]|nr:hypothetical protein [Candidatus Daviesbacteria bacterium]
MDKFKPYNLWFTAAWFGASFICLAFSILLSFYLSSAKIVKPASQSFKLYAAIPRTGSQISHDITLADARPKIIENFFRDYQSPLSDYSNLFVLVADKYKLDYKLLPSIAMQESNGGQKVINNSYNPFGYGIYGNLVIKFASWEEAVEKVGKALRQDYLNQGLHTPAQIMTKYTPPSLAKGGSWAIGVSSFMEELR